MPSVNRRLATLLAHTALVISLGSAIAQDRVNKLPVPTEEEERTAQALVRDLYKADREKAKSSPQKIELAKKLLRDGLGTKDDPSGQYVLLKVAKDMAVQEGEIETAFQAIEGLAATFEIDDLEMRTNAVSSAAKVVRTKQGQQQLASKALTLIEPLVEDDRFEAAKSLSELALVTARKSADTEAIRLATIRAKETSEIEKLFQAAKAALAVLESTPNDPEANLKLGKFRCFIKQEWETGIVCLARGSNEKLMNLAIKELAAPSASEEQLKIGDAWWDLVEEEPPYAKRALQLHATTWYKRALPSLSGLLRTKVETRLGQVDRWFQFDLSNAKLMDDFVRIKTDKAIVSTQSWDGPMEVNLVARTDSTNIRLNAFGGESVIWGWEERPTELRVRHPGDDKRIGTADVEPLKAGQWHTLRCIIGKDRMQVYTNGKLVYDAAGAHRFAPKAIWINGGFGSVVDVQSASIKRLP